jgi:hypothetical protein
LSDSVHESPALWRHASRSVNAPKFSIENFDDFEVPAFLRKSTEDIDEGQSPSGLGALKESLGTRSKFAPMEFMVRIMHAIINRTRLDVPGRESIPLESEQALEKIRAVMVERTTQGVSAPISVLERFSLIAKSSILFEDALVELVAQVEFPSDLLAAILRIGNFPASVPLAILLLRMNEKLSAGGGPLSKEAICLLNEGIEQNVTPHECEAVSKEILRLIAGATANRWPEVHGIESVGV